MCMMVMAQFYVKLIHANVVSYVLVLFRVCSGDGCTDENAI